MVILGVILERNIFIKKLRVHYKRKGANVEILFACRLPLFFILESKIASYSFLRAF